ncbi:HNH endonuclease, partial [Mycolicibacterium phlei]
MARPRFDRDGRRQYTAAERRLRRRLRALGDPCALCGGEIDYTLPQYDPLSFEVDHIVPVALGGMHTWQNVQASHRRCNRAKSDKLSLPAVAPAASAPTSAECLPGLCQRCNGTH